MITPAEHAEALAWVRADLKSHPSRLRTPALTFAEAVLTRHAPDHDDVDADCKGCSWPLTIRVKRDWHDCPDATDALAFVKAVRG